MDICTPKQTVMKKYLSNKLIITALFVAFCGVAFSQANVDSPYSMFGLGQVRNKTMCTRLQSMGGVSNAMFGKSLLNAANPASYAMMDTLSFLFDAGLYAKSSTFSTSALSERASAASFDYVAMGFSLTNWWKMAVGAQPYSNVGYNVVTSFHDEMLGNYNQTFEGEGGLNQVFWGNAFRLGKHFSIGANASFVFGDSKSTTTLSYPDSTYMISSRRSRDIMVRSFMFDYGFLYQGQLAPDLTLSAGVTYNQKINLKGTQTIYIRSIEGNANTTSTVEYLIDTLFWDKNNDARFAMPHGVGFGVSLHKNNRWILGADFNWTQWSKFTRNGVNDSLQNAWSVAVGGEFFPSSTSISNYWTKVSYRLGGFYEQTYLNINGQSINRIGVTAGMTFPMPRSLSRANLGLEVGKCGTKSANLIQENYVKLTLGVSIHERWFIKRKYK